MSETMCSIETTLERNPHCGVHEAEAGFRKRRQLRTEVELAPLRGDHGDGGVLDTGGAVAVLGLLGLVGRPLRLHCEHGQVLPLVCEQDRVPH